ncbi:MAG: hypothetical protein M3Y67_04685 [Pseudomonadota bacterium]|nr:hypothetical protein [Pseudomonadota bacterium]
MQEEPDSAERKRLRERALSRWDNEGGAPAGVVRPGAAPLYPTVDAMPSDAPQLTNAELVQLRIRVIALENLLIALLGEASDRQLGLVREMAAYISPRPGFTHHPLTLHAAAQMVRLVERAEHFREG